jgi:polysaccharide export outer membrane protein
MKADRNLSRRSFSWTVSTAALSLVLLLPILAAQNAQAQAKDESYIIGIGDSLSVTFWQQPDLSRSVRVDENGMITLPVIGEIKATGLKPSELSKKIVEQMSFYNTPVSQATVVVTQFSSRTIVVSGQVVRPSPLHYERIPDLWKVILDAGGPTDLADLSRVTVVRKEGERSEVISVDLYKFIRDGDFSKAPELHAGDLVNVPPSPYGTPLALGGHPGFEGKNIYFVFGQVTTQGARNLEEGTDVLDAIALAGGVTPAADLRNVRVIIKDAAYSNVVKIDLEKYAQTGSPPRLTLHAEDTIIVPARREGFFARVTTSVGQLLPIVTAAGTLVLLYYTIHDRNASRP